MANEMIDTGTAANASAGGETEPPVSPGDGAMQAEPGSANAWLEAIAQAEPGSANAWLEAIAQAEPGSANAWLEAIAQAERDLRPFTERARKLTALYARQRRDGEMSAADTLSAERRFALLWSNVEILKQATYAQAPKPAVRRRFSDRDQTARAAADLLQRALSSLFERRRQGCWAKAAGRSSTCTARFGPFNRTPPRTPWVSGMTIRIGPRPSGSICRISSCMWGAVSMWRRLSACLKSGELSLQNRTIERR